MALFQYPIRRLIVKPHKVSKARDSYLELYDRSEIWQSHRQHCWRCLSNFKAMRWFKLPISRLRDLTRSYNKTSYRMLKQSPAEPLFHLPFDRPYVSWPVCRQTGISEILIPFGSICACHFQSIFVKNKWPAWCMNSWAKNWKQKTYQFYGNNRTELTVPFPACQPYFCVLWKRYFFMCASK